MPLACTQIFQSVLQKNYLTECSWSSGENLASSSLNAWENFLLTSVVIAPNAGCQLTATFGSDLALTLNYFYFNSFKQSFNIVLKVSKVDPDPIK